MKQIKYFLLKNILFFLGHLICVFKFRFLINVYHEVLIAYLGVIGDEILNLKKGGGKDGKILRKGG